LTAAGQERIINGDLIRRDETLPGRKEALSCTALPFASFFAGNGIPVVTVQRGTRNATRSVFVATAIGAIVTLTAASASAYTLEGPRWTNQPHSGCCANFVVHVLVQNSPANVVMRPTSTAEAMNAEDYYNSNTSEDGYTQYSYTGGSFTTADSNLNDYYVLHYSAGEAQSVGVHELGHAMGLGHAPGCVIMNAYTSTRWGSCHIDTPQSDDTNGINSLY
jgi:hypothetical protein